VCPPAAALIDGHGTRTGLPREGSRGPRNSARASASAVPGPALWTTMRRSAPGTPEVTLLPNSGSGEYG
jgi:hypothetical protein